MELCFWAYPWDLLDEGIDHALDQMQERAGATGLFVATVYHAGKFLHVHNPRRRVVFLESGTVYYRPDPTWYGKLRIQPRVWPVVAERDFWPELRRETDRRGMTLTAWVLGMHNSGIGFAYPDCVTENAYGDRIYTDLCPNHPDVRAYLVAVVSDIAANLPVDRVVLESFEFMGFLHGYHHELIGVPLGSTVEFLLSLCFCPHCHAAAAKAGVDLPAIRRWVRVTLDRHFADPYRSPVQMSWAELRAALDGEFGEFLDLRQATLTSLQAEITEAVRRVSRARLAILDFGPLYGMGLDGTAWENGVNLAQQLPLVDEIHPTIYYTDLDLLRRKWAEYLELVGDKTLVPAIRAILPETPSRERLKTQLEPLMGRANGFSFYNYGIMPLCTLDWIKGVIAELTGGISRDVGT